MNLTGEKCYQKSIKRGTVAEGKAHMARVAKLPCVICGLSFVHVHHAGTGRGGRKDDMKVIPLCHLHHTGAFGIHTLGRKRWQEYFDTEAYYLNKTNRLLGEKL